MVVIINKILFVIIFVVFFSRNKYLKLRLPKKQKQNETK